MKPIILVSLVVIAIIGVVLLLKKKSPPTPPPIPPNPYNPITQQYELLPSGNYRFLTSSTLALTIDCTKKHEWDNYIMCGSSNVRLNSNQLIPVIQVDNEKQSITTNINGITYYLSDMTFISESDKAWIQIKNPVESIVSHITGILLARNLKDNRIDILKLDTNGNYKIINIMYGGAEKLD